MSNVEDYNFLLEDGACHMVIRNVWIQGSKDIIQRSIGFAGLTVYTGYPLYLSKYSNMAFELEIFTKYQ